TGNSPESGVSARRRMFYDFNLLATIITIAVVMGAIQGTCAYLIYVERKLAAHMQDRIGPNRVGPFGLLQPIADGLKFLFKEDIIPSHVDRVFYVLAPAIVVITATLAFAVIPFGRTTVPPAKAWPQTTAEEAAFNQKHPEFKDEVTKYNQTYQFVLAPHVDV